MLGSSWGRDPSTCALYSVSWNRKRVQGPLTICFAAPKAESWVCKSLHFGGSFCVFFSLPVFFSVHYLTCPFPCSLSSPEPDVCVYSLCSPSCVGQIALWCTPWFHQPLSVSPWCSVVFPPVSPPASPPLVCLDFDSMILIWTSLICCTLSLLIVTLFVGLVSSSLGFCSFIFV